MRSVITLVALLAASFAASSQSVTEVNLNAVTGKTLENRGFTVLPDGSVRITGANIGISPEAAAWFELNPAFGLVTLGEDPSPSGFGSRMWTPSPDGTIMVGGSATGAIYLPWNAPYAELGFLGGFSDVNDLGEATGNEAGPIVYTPGGGMVSLPIPAGLTAGEGGAISNLPTSNIIVGDVFGLGGEADGIEWPADASSFNVFEDVTGFASGLFALAMSPDGVWDGGGLDTDFLGSYMYARQGGVEIPVVDPVTFNPVPGVIFDFLDNGVGVGDDRIVIPDLANSRLLAWTITDFLDANFPGSAPHTLYDTARALVQAGGNIYIICEKPTASVLLVFDENAVLFDSDGDGIPDAVEAAGPFLGAATDSAQAALPIAADGRYVLLETSQGQFSDVSAVTVTPPAGQTAPVGFFDFTVDGLTPGSSTLISITVPDGTLVDDYLKWDGSNNFSSLPFSVNGSVVSLTLTDGGMGDQDGIANGTITDPSGPVVTSTPTHTKSFWLLY